MTDINSTPGDIEDIVDTEDSVTARLDRQADALLEDADRPLPLRQAVREDLDEAKTWAKTRAEHAREAVQNEPIRATLYALGAGVLLGLLLAR